MSTAAPALAPRPFPFRSSSSSSCAAEEEEEAARHLAASVRGEQLGPSPRRAREISSESGSARRNCCRCRRRCCFCCGRGRRSVSAVVVWVPPPPPSTPKFPRSLPASFPLRRGRPSSFLLFECCRAPFRKARQKRNGKNQEEAAKEKKSVHEKKGEERSRRRRDLRLCRPRLRGLTIKISKGEKKNKTEPFPPVQSLRLNYHEKKQRRRYASVVFLRIASFASERESRRHPAV